MAKKRDDPILQACERAHSIIVDIMSELERYQKESSSAKQRTQHDDGQIRKSSGRLEDESIGK